MLSMFLAILAEAQVAVRDKEEKFIKEKREKGVDYREFGVLSHVAEFIRKSLDKAISPFFGDLGIRPDESSPAGPTPGVALAGANAFGSNGNSSSTGDRMDRSAEILAAIAALQREVKHLNNQPQIPFSQRTQLKPQPLINNGRPAAALGPAQTI